MFPYFILIWSTISSICAVFRLFCNKAQIYHCARALPVTCICKNALTASTLTYTCRLLASFCKLFPSSGNITEENGKQALSYASLVFSLILGSHFSSVMSPLQSVTTSFQRRLNFYYESRMGMADIAAPDSRNMYCAISIENHTVQAPHLRNIR